MSTRGPSPSNSKLSLSEKLARRLSFAQKPKSGETTTTREPFRGSSTLRPSRTTTDNSAELRRSHVPSSSPTATLSRAQTSGTLPESSSNRVVPIEAPSEVSTPGPRPVARRGMRGGPGGPGGIGGTTPRGASRRGASPVSRGGRGGARGLPTPQGNAGIDPKNAWVPFQSFATVIQRFEASGKYQLSLQLGDKVRIQEQTENWYKGIVLSTRKKGIFPKTFVHVSKKLYENEDQSMEELQVALWEWVSLLKTYYQERRGSEFGNMQSRILQLMDWYAKIQSPLTDEGVKSQLKARVFDKIEEGKRKMGLDVIVRRPDGTRCTEQNTGVITLYHEYESLANETALSQKDKKKKEKEKGAADLSSLILLELKLFACSVGEPTEVFFSLWNASTNQFVSESFCVKLTAQGMPQDESRIGNIKTVFKDVSTEDLDIKLFLFVKLVRIGKLEKKGKNDYRIPYGGALIGLCGLKKKETEVTLPVYTTTLENSFHNLPEMILKQRDVALAPKAKGVIVGLTQYMAPPDELTNHNLGAKVDEELANVRLTEKYGFPEIVYPGSSRNDFYLTLSSGEFAVDKTFEVEVVVRMNNGEVLPDCIRMGSSEMMESSYHTTILYHTSNPKWNECISLLIPPTVYERCHLFFTVRICSAGSAKEYANGFLLLQKEDGTVINDGHKQVSLFRMPKQVEDPVVYLNDPMKLINRKGESLSLVTLLCSTALTQNSYVRSLLKWNSDPSKLPEVLNRFTFGSQFEIIKFMQETFDAMCQILDSKLENNIDGLVYDAIVFVIGILVDEKTSRFTNFAPVLDTYLTRHFRSNRAHTVVISCFKEYLDDVEQKAKQVLASLKAFMYLLKIIKRSLTVDRLSQGQVGYEFSEDTAAKKSLTELFQSMNNLMSKRSPALIGAQAALLKNWSSWSRELSDFFTAPELAELTAQITAADQRKGPNMKTKINIGKLEVFSSALDGPLFDDEESRNILTPVLFEHLNVSLTRVEITEVQTCVKLYSKLLHLYSEDRETFRIFLGYLVALLPALSVAVETIKSEEGNLLAITCLLTVYHTITPAHFNKIIEQMSSTRATEFLSKQCQMMFVWCRGKSYPDNWFSLKMFQMATMKKMLLCISEAIRRPANEDWSDETRSLWLNFFQAGFAFLDCPVLRLEAFSAAKQSLIRECYGDMRLGVSSLLKKLWDGIGPKQSLLSTDLVKEFLLVSMIQQRDIRNLGINLYFSALEKEFRAHKNFKTIESQTIDAFSASLTMHSDSVSTVNYNEHFFQALEAKLTRTPDIAPEARKFLSDLKELCQHLVALSTLRDGDHEDDRTIATLRLMEYLRQSQRINAYVRYVHNLVEQQTKSKHYNKAGMILQLHSELLNWEHTTSDSRAPGSPAGETQFALKARLYEQTIELFEQGAFYEQAILLNQELCQQVRDQLCDYKRVASLLQREASLYESMLTAQRYPCEYFRVAFYGKGFASNLRDKEFIYCGYPLERIGEFTERILSKFPSAELMKTTEKPPPEILKAPGMFIQLFMVKPFPTDMDSPFKSHSNMPASLREYRLFMYDVNRFLYKRPFGKDKAVRKENEFKDLWTMDILYITKSRFPVITDRSEIVEVVTKEVTPVENAVQTIKSKNEELRKLAEQYKDCKGNASPFTMVLSGTIDAAVSGGIENYKKAFLTPDYVKEQPEHQVFIDELCDAFTTQLEVLSECIVVHSSICPDSMRQLQDHLEEKLKELQGAWSGGKANQAPAPAPAAKVVRTTSSPSNDEGGWARAPTKRREMDSGSFIGRRTAE